MLFHGFQLGDLFSTYTQDECKLILKEADNLTKEKEKEQARQVQINEEQARRKKKKEKKKVRDSK